METKKVGKREPEIVKHVAKLQATFPNAFLRNLVGIFMIVGPDGRLET